MPVRTLRAARVALTATALALACLLPAPAAFAHDQLISSSPSAGEALADSPDQIVLTMSADALAVGTDVLVTDLDGTAYPSSLTLAGAVVSVDLDHLPDGFYDVRWRVVSSDGHPISGIIPFSVGPVGARPSGGSAGESNAAEESPSGTTPPQPANAAGQGIGASSSPLRPLAIAAGGALVALGLLGAIGQVRNRRTTRQQTTSDQEKTS